MISQLGQIHDCLLKIRFFLVMESEHFALQANIAILVLNKPQSYCKGLPQINQFNEL